MISELVDGSACTKPPVDGPCDADTGVVDALDAPLAPLLVPDALVFCARLLSGVAVVALLKLVPLLPEPLPLPLKAARSDRCQAGAQ